MAIINASLEEGRPSVHCFPGMSILPAQIIMFPPTVDVPE
jgi:hypothetical protein